MYTWVPSNFAPSFPKQNPAHHHLVIFVTLIRMIGRNSWWVRWTDWQSCTLEEKKENDRWGRRREGEIVGIGVGKETRVCNKEEKRINLGESGERSEESHSSCSGYGRHKKGYGKRKEHYNKFDVRLWIASPLIFLENLNKAVDCFQIILNVLGSFIWFCVCVFVILKCFCFIEGVYTCGEKNISESCQTLESLHPWKCCR